MTRQAQSPLPQAFSDLSAGRIDRRRFLAAAAKTGLSVPLAAALYESAISGGLAAGSGAGRIDARFQDGGKTLVVSIAQSTVQLDPAIAGSNGYGDIIPINENLNEGLTRYKNGTAEIEPALAESWTVSADGLTYVFKIRPNVTFHDGTPLDAKAVETNFLRQLDPNHPLHADGMVYVEIVFAEVDTIKATGDLELTITLKRPITLLPSNLAIFAAGIVSPAALEQYKDDYSQHASGTGPFKLDHWTKDVELVFTANENYWGGRPKLDRIIWRSIADDTVRLSELQTGGVDVANQIDFKDVETVKNDPNLQVVSGTFWNTQFLAVNQAIAPFDNAQVRQALQYAVNKQNIADVVFYGNYTLGAGPIAPGLLGYDESLAQTYGYDPDQAKSLLLQAGASNLSFDLYNRTNSFWPLLGQLIQADLDAVGIKANLVSLEDAEFFAQIGAGKAPAFLNDWTWDNGDPDNIMFPLFASPRAETRLGYKNERVIELVVQAQTEKDPQVRTQLYLEAQKLILTDAINVILGYPDRIMGAAKKVQNLVLSPIGNIVLRDADTV
ncbi:MAG: peptide/nickel transport system substrate-binding protein [Thermomicrobiales bacterium]|jgi:peptide/nickel transport system substrate-binding protein|nr:peptide/nickel transport system substrate-binding protein [Thermomicrobiales bacterium]